MENKTSIEVLKRNSTEKRKTEKRRRKMRKMARRKMEKRLRKSEKKLKDTFLPPTHPKNEVKKGAKKANLFPLACTLARIALAEWQVSGPACARDTVRDARGTDRIDVCLFTTV